MTLMILIAIMIIAYLLMHLGVMYIHAKYKLFVDEESLTAIHIFFGILGFALILAFILFVASL